MPGKGKGPKVSPPSSRGQAAAGAVGVGSAGVAAAASGVAGSGAQEAVEPVTNVMTTTGPSVPWVAILAFLTAIGIGIALSE